MEFLKSVLLALVVAIVNKTVDYFFSRITAKRFKKKTTRKPAKRGKSSKRKK